jgi:leucyl aminopeptidase
VENRDHEGKLVLVATLLYSKNFWPWFVTDTRILTKEMKYTVGLAATGVYTSSDSLWEHKRMAEVHIGDRMWRFPPWNFYTKQVTVSQAKIKNIGFGKGGGSSCCILHTVCSIWRMDAHRHLQNRVCQCN